MDFEFSDKVKELQKRLTDFMNENVYKNEEVFEGQLNENGRWTIPPILEEMKSKAKKEGLWNLFLPESDYGAGLKNIEYAPLCEIMGRSPIGAEVFNCSAPDTGNMEVFVRYGTEEQKEKWLNPLLNGEIRSSFAMTEPAVASSDASNIQGSIVKDGDEYVINARKWWTSGAMDPRCKIIIFMGKTDPNAEKYKQQSMILIPKETKGVQVLRHLPVFGYDDAPHGHGRVSFKDVRVPKENLLLGEGRGFEIAQGRLGPGRIHHCMRTIGVMERALELMCKRSEERVAFGKKISTLGANYDYIAESRIDIETSRLLTLNAAHLMDTVGNKVARSEIAQIKVYVPIVACRLIDRAIQMHGGGGVSQDFPLASMYAHMRTLRIADGPDEVHRRTVAREELGKYGGGQSSEAVVTRD